MKKDIVVSVIMAVTFLATSFFVVAQPQDTASEEKPTFYRLTPGVYVNGFPRFTVTYPKDWVEEKPAPQEVFRAASPDPPHGEKVIITVFSNPLPLDHLVDDLLLFWKNVAKDVTVVSDKPSQLRDGIPAREVEVQMVMNGLPLNYLSLATTKDNMVSSTGVGSFRGNNNLLQIKLIKGGRYVSQNKPYYYTCKERRGNEEGRRIFC